MNCTEFYQLMANPVRMTEKTIPELQQIVMDFPFFHAARVLYLQKLAVSEDIRLHIELRKMAIHIPDRIKLFMLIERDSYIDPSSNPIQEISGKKPFVQDTENVGQRVEDLGNDNREEHLIFEPTILSSIDYTRLLEDDDQTTDASQPKMQHQELIDWFIQNEQTRKNSRILKEPEKTDSDSDEIIMEPDHWDNTLENSYFTETLANIYIKQKRYDKALEIIKRLSLKYPKKNIYFADQLEFLEKLIINVKNNNK